MALGNLFLYIFSFVLIWLGSGLIVSSTSRFAERLRLSSFAVSFLLLGLLTSTPEFSVGLQAVADQSPGIFVGNLLGGIIVIFLLIIPLLAIFGNGISLKHELDQKTLLIASIVIAAPSIFVLDKKVTSLEGLVLIVIYLILVFIVQRKNGLFDQSNSRLMNVKSYSYKDILKVLLGIGLVFLSSHVIVEQTVFFANALGVSTFYIGLLVVALGTDLPELTLALRSVITGKKEIAMGDYLGAAAGSTLLFGLFTLLSDGEVLTVSNFLTTFVFIALGIGFFFFFSRTKQYLSRNAGFMMLGTYALFIIFELAS